MEGNLLKWTNYWMGWQLRWFVLKDGVLSYYNNQNESKTGGCKRSYKIFLFDIIVNKNDNTRVDLIVANDQHLYLKACDYKERQKWLVALASQKASYPGNSVMLNKTSASALITNPLTDQTFSNTDDKSKLIAAQQILTPLDTTNLLKIKQSELRLYCDLLTQQTHDMKNLVLSLKSTVNSADKTLKKTPSNSNIDKVHLIPKQNENNNNENVSAASSFKSLNDESLLGQLESTTNVEDSANNNNNNNNTVGVAVNDNIKKMDDITSNINITCDMLIQIIRNLVVLSNTSSNISPAAVSSLLEEASNNPLPSILTDSFDDLSKYQYHLYHPLHTNSQLTQFKKNQTSSSALPSSNSKKNNEKKSANGAHKHNVDDLIDDNVSLASSITSSSIRKSRTTKLKNFNYLTNHAPKININLADSISPSGVMFSLNEANCLSRHYFNNLPSLHNYKTKSLLRNSNSSLNSITTMTISNYSIECLKETAINANRSKEISNQVHNKSDIDSILGKESRSLTPIGSNHSSDLETDPSVKMLQENLNPALEGSKNTDEKNKEINLTKPYVYSTFFNCKPHKFHCIKLTKKDEIPTDYFLSCCSDIFSIFDNFGSTAFIPVKVDIYGNISKLKQKYSTDPKRYHTLQSMIQQEMDENVTRVKNSATDALMWLKRAIWFLREFLYEFSNKEDPDMAMCVYESYQRTLRQYHNWVVRSIFSLAMRSLPTKESFLEGLAVDGQDYLKNKQLFENQCKMDMKVIINGIDIPLNIINEFYSKNNLET